MLLLVLNTDCFSTLSSHNFYTVKTNFIAIQIAII